MEEEQKSPEECKHERCQCTCKVTRIYDAEETKEVITGYKADIEIHCAQCGQAFQFIGVPTGCSEEQPTSDIDGEYKYVFVTDILQ